MNLCMSLILTIQKYLFNKPRFFQYPILYQKVPYLYPAMARLHILASNYRIKILDIIEK